MNLKQESILLVSTAFLALCSIAAINIANTDPRHSTTGAAACGPEEPACVIKTIFGLEDKQIAIPYFNPSELPAEARAAIDNGLNWIQSAQLQDGGWGAGSHAYQNIRDPQQVQSDPATTSLVAMAILRTGSTLSEGKFSEQLKKATLFLLKAVDDWKPDQVFLTTQTGTQPQTKLGQNIDAILTVQYFTNLVRFTAQHQWHDRIRDALQKCVDRIEKQQASDGSWKNGGWAPVLQSALADNALESAKEAGMAVDSVVLQKSKNYQKGNYDTATRSAVTGNAAGIMLYSLSSTSRSSAREARQAKDMIDEAKRKGKIRSDATVNEVNLQAIGVAPAEARELVTAYRINEGTMTEAVREDVMSGFGNNGGEEFLSYLMTGESIMIQGGDDWKKWYDMMSKKLITIQEKNGSWQGHHCITSPVFCTATCLLILSIQNDLKIQIPGR